MPLLKDEAEQEIHTRLSAITQTNTQNPMSHSELLAEIFTRLNNHLRSAY
jgi:hypothetical protein